MFFRDKVLTTLRLRRGSDDESPMDEEKVSRLRASFPELQLHYPEMVFLRLGASFFFRDHALMRKTLERLDTLIARVFPAASSYSYFDVIELVRRDR